MKKTAKYSTSALLAVCASFVMTVGVAAVDTSATLTPQHKTILQQSLDEQLILAEAPKEGAKGSSGKGKVKAAVSKAVLKACKTECKPAYRKCVKKCYNTEDDIACKVACKATRTSCIDTCAQTKK